MSSKVRVAILEDHQSTIDGYLYRLKDEPQIEIVGVAAFGAELAPLLAKHPADVVLLDVNVPTAPDNPNPYPILHLIPELLQKHPSLNVLVISMLTEHLLIQAVMNAGASGYLMKDDGAAIRELGAIVLSVANGGIHLSPQAHQQLFKRSANEAEPALTRRQLEALSLAAAYPDDSTAELADKLGVSHPTLRNLLSGAYLRLDVRHRTAAVAKARKLGLITPEVSLERLKGPSPE